MSLRRVVNGFLKVCAFAWLSVASLAIASEYHGVVTFGGLPLPGTTVTVTATQGDKKVVAVSDEVGAFSFADLADGTWAIDIEMTGFAPLKQDVTVAPTATPGAFEMKLLSLDQIRAEAKPVKAEAAPAVSVATTAPETTAPAATTPAGGKAAAGKAATKGATDKTQAASGAAPDAGPAPAAPPPDPNAQASNDGFLINGSVNNAATSQYSMSQAFGNNRGNGRSLYNGGFSLVVDSSALDAKNYSLSGLDSPKDSFTNLIGGFTFGGPLKIPHLLPRGPNFYVSYQRTETSNISTPPNLVPTAAQDSGNFSSQSNISAIFVPSSLASNPASPCYVALIGTGLTPVAISAGTAQFVNKTIPSACISSTAQGLLAYYPQPNVTGNSLYNFQVPLANDNHQDAYRLQMNKQLGSKNNLNGNFTFADTRSSSPSIFGFLDKSNQLNISTNVNWSHRFTQRLGLNASYSFSRSRSQNTPFFEGRTNVSGNVGITGNDQDAANWGPPSLGFASIAGLSDGKSSYNRPETNSYSVSISWNRFRHNVQAGADFRRQENNYFTQSNPRGSLGFTGLSTQGPGGTGGSDFADFLLGLPDTSSLAFGNADKYLRQSVYDGYVNDDFRVNPELSINAGIRWDYGAPVTELKGRLVNLNTGTGFTTATPVLGSNPTGVFPSSLIRPDRIGFAPIIGIAWRPISGSSLLVRSGYGLYHDTSLYQATALAMAQQAPLSTSVSVEATNATAASTPPTCPFTIAISHPFTPTGCPGSILQTFAVDPNFRVGYAQSWNLSVQRDLPFALQMVAGYLGIKGTRGVQEFLPNTYPIGATDPYGNAPVGYYYRTSGGNSTRQQGSIQLRRRLRNGFQANLMYTYSKSLDDDYALGGQGPVTASGNASPQIAQDWTNPAGQRGLSTFDQRHVMNLQMQYTTGMGIGGHTMMSGWRALAYKEWTVVANFGASTGLPETPVYPFGVPGTAFTGSIRANYLGGPIHIAPTSTGIFLNQAAFGPPTLGQWGNARRDSIEGPSSFTFNASMDRTFRLRTRYNLETRLDATNILNHVAYTSYNTTVTTVGTTQFGAAGGTGNMRSMQLTMRLRF